MRTARPGHSGPARLHASREAESGDRGGVPGEGHRQRESGGRPHFAGKAPDGISARRGSGSNDGRGEYVAGSGGHVRSSVFGPVPDHHACRFWNGPRDSVR